MNIQSDNLKADGFDQALALFRAAAKRVPAYRDFLAKAGVKPGQVKTRTDFTQVPTVDKTNYVTKYPLEQLCWDGNLKAVRQLPMSSGTTGQPFFWPVAAEQNETSGQIFDRIFKNIFHAGEEPTLFVTSFGMGGWKAGQEFYGAARWVADQGRAVTVVTPGLDIKEVTREVAALAPHFKHLIVAGYGPFVKDILAAGRAEGIEWQHYDTYLFTAGEAISEAWRDRVLELAGQSGLNHAINLYGMAEIGALAHETPLSIALRRSIDQTGNALVLRETKMTCLYQFDPQLRYFETGADGVLLLTANAGLPLIRYHTRDRGGVLSFADGLALGGQKFTQSADHSPDSWRLPFVYLFGRDDLSAHFYAVNIYIENIKTALEDRTVVGSVSGIFVMETKQRRNLDKYLSVTVEMRSGRQPTRAFKQKLGQVMVRKLRQCNSEYNKLYDSLGTKVAPEITLKAFGTIGYVPGKKHKWVKRG